jgi:hypothetical protein
MTFSFYHENFAMLLWDRYPVHDKVIMKTRLYYHRLMIALSQWNYKELMRLNYGINI